MRLDRVLLGGDPVQVKDITIVMNKSVKGEQKQVESYFALKGGLLFMRDKLGLELGRPDKEEYLFPSDHFGLYAHLYFP